MPTCPGLHSCYPAGDTLHASCQSVFSPYIEVSLDPTTYPKALTQPLTDTEEPLRSAVAQPGLEDHLIQGAPGPWAFWRWACLRGSGFPSRMIEGLASPALAERTERLIDAEIAARQAQADLSRVLRARLDETEN